jgi:hypothetical protein
MSFRPRLSLPVWLIALLCALGFLIWTDSARIQHVDHATHLAQQAPERDPGSPTGYAGGTRELIVPEQNQESYDWIAQTQQMFASGQWRVRHIDYENAPAGREVNTASPYRWWLGLTAWFDHLVSGRSIGLSVEHAALFADPLVHTVLLVAAVIFVAWRFGAFSAALLAIALVTIFPFAGAFIPGAPDQRGLAQACGFWSVLLIMAGMQARAPVRARTGAGLAAIEPAEADGRTRRWFFAAGVAGAFGLWISVSNQVPVLAGIGLGAIVAAWADRETATAAAAHPPMPWRIWALGGAAATLIFYLIEYFPSHLGSWQLRAIHPLYGLAWLGMGELLAQAAAAVRPGKREWRLRDLVWGLLALGMIAALPVVMKKTGSSGFLALDLPLLRLSKLPNGVVASDFKTWLFQDGFSAKVWATIAPLMLMAPAVWLLIRQQTASAVRRMLAVGLGPALIALGFAWRELNWWNGLDAVLLTVLVAVTLAVRGMIHPRVAGWTWSGWVGLVLVLGAFQLAPLGPAGANQALTQLELRSLIERDLAHWLASRVNPGEAVVLATPNETATLHFYGGLRGVGTLDWENRAGFSAAIRIASASTPEEAHELIRQRKITHIVVPSWDSQLDDYARLGLGQLEGSFISRLHQWALPPWLLPVAYQLPAINGLEGQSISIFKVVDGQDDAARFSRLADYFIETGQLDRATAVGQKLRHYPADVGALTARVDIALALHDTAGFTTTFNSLLTRLSRGADRYLPWDRRVSLAVVLTRGKQPDLARKQVEHCLTGLTAIRLRSLSTGSLYRLQVLLKAFDLAIPDLQLRDLALNLLPPEWRSRL